MSKKYITDECRELVTEMLRRFPICRDDYNKLMANVWHRECKALGLSEVNFLHHLSAGKVSKAESIARVNRELQRDFPALRGNRYLERQARASAVQEELGYE